MVAIRCMVVMYISWLRAMVHMNDLDILACDLENAYLNAPCAEKIWFEGGPECGEDQGKVLVITRVLYGLKSAGFSLCHSTDSRGPHESGRNSDVTDNRNVLSDSDSLALVELIFCRHNLSISFFWIPLSTLSSLLPTSTLTR